KDLERRCGERLSAALMAHGWTVEARVRVPGSEARHVVDVIARKGPRTYVIEVKVATAGHSAALAPLAAAGLLQARRYAPFFSGEPMVVVAAPRLSPANIEEIRRFLADFGDGAAWGVFDGSSHLELHGPALEAIHAAGAPRQRA